MKLVQEAERVQDQIERADTKLGAALREWLESEQSRSDFDFADTAFTLNYVMAKESTAFALQACVPRRHREMRRWYALIVAWCTDSHFEMLVEGDNDDHIH